MLDTRYNIIRTHHFFILNHFRYGTKISIPYYLFFFVNMNIMGYKQKSYANPTFHEGLLLLIYECFKAQTHGNIVESLEDTESSYLPSDIEDSVGLHSNDEEEVAKMIKDLGKIKKKKVGKGLIGKSIKFEVNCAEDYNEEDEGMDTEEEINVKEEGTSRVLVLKKVESLAKRRTGIDMETD